MRHVAVLLAAVLFAGCAFTNIPLTLPVKGLENTIPGGRGREIVVVVPFVDQREIRDRCGMQKNGYNMDTADAVCQSDPNAWLAQLLADELRASGFEVVTEDASGADPDTVRIEGALLKIFVEPVIGFWSGSLEADLSARLVVSTASGLQAERMFFAKAWKGGTMLSTMQPYHTALQRATHDLLEQMVRAIVELMDRYPDLGARSEPDQRLLVAFRVGERSR